MDDSSNRMSGEHNDMSWTNDLEYFPDLAFESFMYSGHEELSLGADVSFDDIFPNVLIEQSVARTDGTAQALLKTIYDRTADVLEPRSDIPRPRPTLPVFDSNLGFLYPPNTLSGDFREEPEYTHARIPHGKSAGLSLAELEKWKSELEDLYFLEGSTLENTRAEMARRGVNIGATSYKRKIKEWGWKTYKLDKEGNTPAAPKSVKRVRRTAPNRTTVLGNESANRSPRNNLAASPVQHPRQTDSQPARSEITLCPSSQSCPAQSTSTPIDPTALKKIPSSVNCSNCTTLSPITPFRLPPTPTDYPHMKFPPAMRDTDFDATLSKILNNVKDLYISYPALNKWKVQNRRQVEEDIHDELLVGVAASVKNVESLSRSIGNRGFNNVLQMIGKVVGEGEGRDCGLFSLPAILISFLRLIREDRPAWARRFLTRVSIVAKQKFGNKHPFVQVLSSLQKIYKKDPDRNIITKVVLGTYGRCVEDVKANLGPFHLTYLSLWGDFVVYLDVDGRSVHDTQAWVGEIRSLIKMVDEEKGPNAGPNSDYALELLGLILYVLQSCPGSQEMAEQAEEVAKELNRRLEERKIEDGGQLTGDLLVTWKDLRHLLGKLFQDKKTYYHYLQAIVFLEEFLNYDIEDERDACALEKLERCYEAVGRYDAAKDVKRRRMEASEKMLKNTEKNSVKVSKVAGDFEAPPGDGDREGNVDGAGENSDSTVEGQGGGHVEEGIADGDGDSEVEIQVLEEAVAGMQQRVQHLKRKRNEDASRLEAQREV